MKIEFFANESGMDNGAVLGGVFAIEAENAENGKSALIYIRESSNMAAKASNILKKTFVYPEYLGLTKGMVGSDNLIVRVKVIEYIRTPKIFSTLGVYRDAEVVAIKEHKPLIQYGENHHLISERKREKFVRAALEM